MSGPYSELYSLCKGYIDTVNELYTLHTFNEDAVNKILAEIKRNFIETKIYMPSQVPGLLSTIATYNNRYFKVY